MDIFDIEYGYNILKQFNDKITKHDYTRVTEEKNPLNHSGISLHIYDGIISASINYQSDRVLFRIEDVYSKFIDNNIFHTHLTKAHYSYFADTYLLVRDYRKTITEKCSKFRQVLPIEYIRDEKLKEII